MKKSDINKMLKKIVKKASKLDKYTEVINRIENLPKREVLI